MDPSLASIILALTNLEATHLTGEELRDLFTGTHVKIAGAEIFLPKEIQLGAFGGKYFLEHGRHRVFIIVTDCSQSAEVEGA